MELIEINRVPADGPNHVILNDGPVRVGVENVNTGTTERTGKLESQGVKG